MIKKSQHITYIMIIIFLFVSNAKAGIILDRIKEKNVMSCAFTQPSKGLTYLDDMGNWTGFFADFCRVYAIAVTGSSKAVEWNLIDTVHRFDALVSDEIDVLVANTTWTNRRDTELGIKFTGTFFYDGQGFLAHQSLNVKNLDELDKASICVGAGTTTLLNLQELIKTTHPNLTMKVFKSVEERESSFFAHKCDIMTDDTLALASYQQTTNANLILFPDIISKEPLGPAVSDDDMEWFNIVRWSLFVLIAAEELGITSKNIDQMLDSKNPKIMRLLGVDGNMGESMGLSNDWAYKVIKEIGNYGEIFERNIGIGTDMKIERGLNRLWKDGGLLYSPPFR